MTKKPSEKQLKVSIFLVFVPFAIVIGGLLYSYFYIQDYLDFNDDFLVDINYAIEENSMTAQYKDVTTQLTQHNTEKICNLIIYADFDKYVKEMPAGEYILFDFGNGNTMKVIGNEKYTVIVEYAPAGEDTVLFTTSTEVICAFIDLERLISEEWDNEVVNE